MARLVQKFGGTSVADIERIKSAARRVKAEIDDGNQVAVVLSAMAGATIPSRLDIDPVLRLSRATTW